MINEDLANEAAHTYSKLDEVDSFNMNECQTSSIRFELGILFALEKVLKCNTFQEVNEVCYDMIANSQEFLAEIADGK